MCLSVPAKIVSIDGKAAVVEVYSERREVYLSVDNAVVGDWVLVYGALALHRLESAEAEETLKLLAGLFPDSKKSVE